MSTLYGMLTGSLSFVGQRILAFFGMDLQDAGPAYLGDRVREGFTLLALDPAALYLAKRARLEFTLLDDWVDTASRLEARRMAETWDRKWFSSSRDEFTIDGICWPQIDRHAMNWFWSEIAYATKLAESFCSRGIRSVRLLRSGLPRPSVYYAPADILSASLGSLNRGGGFEVEVAARPGSLLAGVQRQLKRVARRLKREIRSASAALSGADPKFRELGTDAAGIRRGRIVFAFSSGEMHRFLPVVEQVKAGIPGEMSAEIVDIGSVSMRLAAVDCTSSATPDTGEQLLRPEFRARFRSGMDVTRRAAAGMPWEQALNATRFHFDYFCEERWPNLVADYRRWGRLWSVVQPRAVVVSSLYDAESQLPALAARRLGIETLSIPHGGSQMLDDLISAEKILYGYELQRRIWQLSGIPDMQLTPCRGIVPTNEYPVKAYPAKLAQDKLRILVLLDPVAAFDQRLLPRVSLALQLEALNALANPPLDLAGTVSVRIKTHPNHPEQELFLSCSPSMESMVLPPDHSLDDALSHSDLVVTLNYVGSAFIHVHLLGKPVVHFWNDPLVGETGLESIGGLISAGGLLISRVGQFWGEIDRIRRDPAAIKALSHRSRQYAETYLDDREFPGIHKILAGIHAGPEPIAAENLLESS